MFSGTFNARDALFTIDVAIGTETLGNLVAERFCFGFGDDAIPLAPADVESNQPGAV